MITVPPGFGFWMGKQRDLFPTWDIMIPSIPHRYIPLCALLEEINRQWRPGLGVLLFFDNIECPVGKKYDIMAHQSQAEYLSVLEDDDWIARDFVARLSEAMLERPDYIGFPVHWTHNGREMMPVEHSLRHREWTIYDGTNDKLLRDICQFNPIRRELALLGEYEAHPPDEKAWDWHWVQGVRQSGMVKTEVWIPDTMHYYRTLDTDTFMTPRVPWPEEEIPPVPDYPWLTEVHE